MDRSINKTVLLIVILAVTCSSNDKNTTIQGLTPDEDLYEERGLEIVFVNYNPELETRDRIKTELKTSILSEYPEGDILSNMTLRPVLEVVSRDRVQSLFTKIYNKTKYNATSQEYFIHYSKFNDLIEEDSGETYSYETIRLYIINFNSNDSIFGQRTVYIDYAINDTDTGQVSRIRPLASYGVGFALNERPVAGMIVSTRPKYENADNYPYLKDLLTHKTSTEEWNERLITHIKAFCFSRLNPSPVFKYNYHKEIRVNLALITLGTQEKAQSMVEYLDMGLIHERMQQLVPYTQITIRTTLIDGPEELCKVQRQLLSLGWKSKGFFVQECRRILWTELYRRNRNNSETGAVCRGIVWDRRNTTVGRQISGSDL